MSDRRLWILAGVVAVVMLGMLGLKAWSGAEDTADPGVRSTPSSSSPSTDAAPSSSSGLPSSPDAGISPSAPASAASPSVSPTASSSSSVDTQPPPESSIGEDGLPVVTIDRPEPGASVSSLVQMSGTAVAFEAALRWEILDSRGKRVAGGPAYADAGAPERGRWQAEVDLPTGRYSLVAFVESPNDGERIARARVKFRVG